MMKVNFTHIAPAVFFLACMLACMYFLGMRKGVKKTDEWYKAHMDTTSVVQIDTNKIEKPVADTIYVDSLVYLPVYIDPEIPEPQIIYRDSIHYVLMEKVVKEYKSDNYYAKISGVEPNLDFIETYNTTITNTVYVPQKIEPKRNFFAIEGAVMYDVVPLAPVTANVGYRRGLFEVSAGAGYDFFQKAPIVKTQLRVGFSF